VPVDDVLGVNWRADGSDEDEARVVVDARTLNPLLRLSYAMTLEGFHGEEGAEKACDTDLFD